MPLYDWTPSREFTTRPEMLSHITSLISSPPGSIWLALMRRQRSDGAIAGHAVPILRTSEGLAVIPTRILSSTSLELYHNLTHKLNRILESKLNSAQRFPKGRVVGWELSFTEDLS
ncbi:hypothetical protein LEP1GSC082_0947 [Leptospira kirschneri str. H2]|nr:hypothetical protein LEP1GSC082_0947 [Leptospira kirschneri str. H2]